MATKLVFITQEGSFFEEEFEYDFSPGFSIVQKRKNIQSLNESIHKKYPLSKILEVSTKSDNELGILLSAFNLKLNGIPVESIFQSSKVSIDGIQYDFLINCSANEAKKYVKEHPLGQLKCFRYQGVEYPLFPESAFYDFIYLKALASNREMFNSLKKYDVFTDVEFNSKKSLNCQARACSIYSYLLRVNKVDDYLSSFDKFVEVYKINENILLF